MTDWIERSFKRAVYEFEVPTPEPHGATGKDFDIVWSHAVRLAKHWLGIPKDESLPENVLHIKPADEGVIIWFEVEEKQAPDAKKRM